MARVTTGMAVNLGKTMRQSIAAGGAFLIVGGMLTAPVSAQTVDCPALISVLMARAAAGQHMVDQLTQAGIAASMADIKMAYDPLYLAQHYAETNCSELRPAAPPTPGADGMQQGRSVHFAQGAFLKVGAEPTIYEVWNGQRFAIQSWEQYLRLGGLADLSNIYSVTTSDLASIPSAGIAAN